ncbi:MFS transporter [Candidatus Halobonum tyrrellensis]|uniref:Major facilitator superfamily protein n=1 Tax=Candidatus Halobonum tyrrellensis G22 TaxID=1324957 RepID=V4HEZ5_9EURY|nr:MFS transporter [Candidatus Halobonum tyrrellensis]ESP89280.1 major facilitator superfamily protein [Candidatus Halobonum tyrrellensis G22]
MGDPPADATDSEPDPLGTFRGFLALSGDVLVLSVAMFAFSLGFQMTGRYMPVYLDALGASSVVVGLYRTVGDLIGAVYPYPGGALSDRIGSRTALTAFGLASTVGFLVWWAAGDLASVAVGPTSLAVVLLFFGLFLSQAWKSFGLGATFAVVKQSVPPSRLAAGFASTETFRRTAFLLGPLLAAGVLAAYAFESGFRVLLLVAAGFGLLATVAQHVLYDASEDSLGTSFEGLDSVRADLRALPDPLRPLLVGDTLVRFANGMVYAFFSLVVVNEFGVGVTLPVVGRLPPAAFFGVLLAVEMAVALLTMVPVARLAERVGLKPVVALGFAVYAAFPVVLITAPRDPVSLAPVGEVSAAAVLVVLFAFSGLRFAGLPAHKALIVGPAESGAGGRVTGSYYLVRNVVVIPSGLVGGYLYDVSPTAAFTLATVVGLVGTVYFLARGEEFEAYA